jgi:hypothetical protein
VAAPKSSGSRLIAALAAAQTTGSSSAMMRCAGVPDEAEAQPRRNQIGGERLEIAEERILQRDPGPRRGGAERRGMAHAVVSRAALEHCVGPGGADPARKDKEGRTAHDLAAASNSGSR